MTRDERLLEHYIQELADLSVKRYKAIKTGSVAMIITYILMAVVPLVSFIAAKLGEDISSNIIGPMFATAYAVFLLVCTMYLIVLFIILYKEDELYDACNDIRLKMIEERTIELVDGER